jgi:hypothetical protein
MRIPGMVLLGASLLVVACGQLHNAGPPTPTPGPAAYASKHGFSVEYPPSWTLQSAIESYPSIQQARYASGNHFQLYSYTPASDPSADVPPGQLKIDATISDNLEEPLDKWIASQTSGGAATIDRTEDLIINRKPSRKVWLKTDTSSALAVYYGDGERAAEFRVSPPDTPRAEDVDTLLRTFKFTDNKGVSEYGAPKPGVMAEVYGTGSCLNVRQSASISAGIKFCVTDGTIVTVDSGPVEADNYRWWRLRSFDGWAVEDYIKYDAGQ